MTIAQLNKIKEQFNKIKSEHEDPTTQMLCSLLEVVSDHFISQSESSRSIKNKLTTLEIQINKLSKIIADIENNNAGYYIAQLAEEEAENIN